jgi:hypothetical protein
MEARHFVADSGVEGIDESEGLVLRIEAAEESEHVVVMDGLSRWRVLRRVLRQRSHRNVVLERR